MSVLILTTSNNPHGEAVSSVVRSAGVEVIRLDFDQFSTHPPMVSVRLGDEQEICFGGDAVSPRSISGIFVHHPRLQIDGAAGVDLIDRRLWELSWTNAVDWLETILPKARWINRLSSCRFSTPSLLQLQTASRAGLLVPPTIYTNSVSKLREFASECGAIVLKSGPVPGVVPDQHRLLTSLVDPAAIEEVELASSPCMFQEYIEKKFELRVHVVGTDVLTCRIDSQANERTRVDWRNYNLANTPHSRYELDEQTRQSCLEVVKNLRLEMGVIDLIVTPDSRIVFLECNAQGSWHWIQLLTGLQITELIAHRLMGD